MNRISVGIINCKNFFNYHLPYSNDRPITSMNHQELLGHLLLATGKVIVFRILQEYLAGKMEF